MKKMLTAILLTVSLLFTASELTPFSDANAAKGVLRTISVSDVAGLRSAVANAVAGDEIIVGSGTYDVTGLTGWRGGIVQARDRVGTADNPIILRSEDATNPARIISTNINENMVLHIWGGDYWLIQNLVIEGGQKGIVLDDCSHTVIWGCEVSGCGQEAVDFRDGTCDSAIINSTVTNTGLVSPGYGEGIYVGSFEDVTAYSLKCDRNLIAHNVIGPGIAADPIDIKGGTYGTVVEYNTIYADGVTGANSSTCHIKLGGNDSVVRFNEFYCDQNKAIRACVENWALFKTMESGQRNQIYNNFFYLDGAEAYSLTGSDWSDPQNWNPFNPPRPVFAIGAWTDQNAYAPGDVFVGENTIINPYTGPTTFGIVHNFLPGKLTNMQLGTYPSIDPDREPGLLSDLTPQPPNLSGRLVYHSYDIYGDGSSRLFILDFSTGGLECISDSWTNVTDPMNAVWTEDGKAVVFMGVDAVTDEPWEFYTWDIFYYEIGSESNPINLTNKPFTRNEDPKIQGDKIVYKAMEVSCNYIRTVSLSDFTIDTVYESPSIEPAMPIYSHDGLTIYFSGLVRDEYGSNEMDLYSILAEGGTAQKIPQKIPNCGEPDVFEYYQAPDENGFFYAAHSENGGGDKIYHKNMKLGTAPMLMPFNGGWETADPCVVSPDCTIFSSIREGGSGAYDLYLYDRVTGQIFPLTTWNNGVNTGMSELAAWYTPTNAPTVQAEDFVVEISDVGGKDCVKITNNTDTSVSTRGMYLTDDEDLFKLKMPVLIIRAGGFVLNGIGVDDSAAVPKRAAVDFYGGEGRVRLVDVSGFVIAESD